MNFDCDNIPANYSNILKYLLDNGEPVSPRGVETIEVRGLHLTSRNPQKRFIAHMNRHANPVFPIIELMWYLSGDDSPTIVSHYRSKIKQYLNPKTGRFDGAYGSRIRKFNGYFDQLSALRRRLMDDQQSRRAIITIFDPTKDYNDDSLDIPCYLSLQFMIRNGNLELTTYARSQDLYMGFVYDTAEWQLLQEIVAGWLGLRLGTFRHYIASAHIYSTYLERVKRIIENDTGFDLYRDYSPQSAALNYEEFNEMYGLFMELEKKSRVIGSYNTVKLHEILSTISVIDNEFWQNAIKAVFAFNASKFGMTDIRDMLLKSINNEVQYMLCMWFSKTRSY